MIHLFIRTDGKRRGLFLVKWAQSKEVLSPPFELDEGRNDFHNVVCRSDFVYFVVWNPHGEMKIQQNSERWKEEKFREERNEETVE